MNDHHNPKLRKPLGVIALLLLIAIYAVVAVTLASPLRHLHALAQLPVWIVLGVLWIPIAMPIVRWIETGKLRR